MIMVAEAAWGTKRAKPYTDIGVRRLTCIRCRANKAVFQWQVCSDGNNWRPLCPPCDIALNRTVLEFMGHPNATALLDSYIAAMPGRPG